MRKTILTVLGSALLAASTAQLAAAAEHHHGRRAVRAQTAVNEQFRNSNADAQRFAPAPPDRSYFEDEAMSPPAGH
jgi:hypothetical protein